MRYYESKPVPRAFFWRRLQSLMGLFLVLFLIEHLVTNSQAGLWTNSDGNGFIIAVNGIRELPYIQVIEILLIGVPFLIHGLWGIKYLLTSKQNAYGNSGNKPYLPYARNRAYTWQRITSWILLIGVILHVVDMRFLNYPREVKRNTRSEYLLPVSEDIGLFTLSKRLGVHLYNAQDIEKIKKRLNLPTIEKQPSQLNDYFSSFFGDQIQQVTKSEIERHLAAQKLQEQELWIEALSQKPLQEQEWMSVSPNFGTAELLLVRDTFKSLAMRIIYTIFVLVACYHAFNGLWTFSITWGITLTARSQFLMRMLAYILMALIIFLGLFAIWGSTLLTLKD